MKILITGAGALLGQGLIRAVRGSALDAKIVAVDPSPLSAGLYWVDAAHLVPMANDPAYAASIETILELERPDAVMVGTDVELAFFSKHRDRLEAKFKTFIVVSSPRVVDIADDKWLTFQFLRDAGFDYPDSALAENANELIARVGFPLVVKPRRGARSIGMSVVSSNRALEQALVCNPDAIIQECVGTLDEEYTSGLICFDGRCCASITMRRDLRDGNTYRARAIPDFVYDNTLRSIAERLGVYGPVNLQFRLKDKKVKVFEINGRFSGTTPLRGLVGFNEVEMILRRIIYGEPITQPKVRDDFVFRHWSETVVPH